MQDEKISSFLFALCLRRGKEKYLHFRSLCGGAALTEVVPSFLTHMVLPLKIVGGRGWTRATACEQMKDTFLKKTYIKRLRHCLSLPKRQGGIVANAEKVKEFEGQGVLYLLHTPKLAAER